MRFTLSFKKLPTFVCVPQVSGGGKLLDRVQVPSVVLQLHMCWYHSSVLGICASIQTACLRAFTLTQCVITHYRFLHPQTVVVRLQKQAVLCTAHAATGQGMQTLLRHWSLRHWCEHSNCLSEGLLINTMRDQATSLCLCTQNSCGGTAKE